MPEPRGGTRRDAVATRKRLIRASLELFTTRGYHATTTPSIAARAGVAEGTIYRHYASKEALLNEVFREAQRWAVQVVREGGDEKQVRAPDRLRRIARRLVQTAYADPSLVRMLLHPRDDVELDDLSREAMRQFQGALVQIVATGKQEGTVRTGSAELWTAVWLALVGFVTERVAAREWAPDHTHVDQALDAAWDAIAWRPSVAAPAQPPAGAGAQSPAHRSPAGDSAAPGSR
jgi:AcrR family transcriptional regulator